MLSLPATFLLLPHSPPRPTSTFIPTLSALQCERISGYQLHAVVGETIQDNCSEVEFATSLDHLKSTFWTFSSVIVLYVPIKVWVAFLRLIRSALILSILGILCPCKLQNLIFKWKLMQKLGAAFMEFPLNPCPEGFSTIPLTRQPPFVTHGMSGKGLQLSSSQCFHL